MTKSQISLNVAVVTLTARSDDEMLSFIEKYETTTYQDTFVSFPDDDAKIYSCAQGVECSLQVVFDKSRLRDDFGPREEDVDVMYGHERPDRSDYGYTGRRPARRRRRGRDGCLRSLLCCCCIFLSGNGMRKKRRGRIRGSDRVLLWVLCVSFVLLCVVLGLIKMR